MKVSVLTPCFLCEQYSPQKLVGCFLGSIATAVFGEKLGRRKTITVGCVIMIIGAILQASSYGRAQMIVARIVSGVGMGIINSTVPVMQAEFSPKSSRGICTFCSPLFFPLKNITTVATNKSPNCTPDVCAQLSTLNFGIFLVYWIDYGFSTHTGSYAWRIPVILQCFCILPMLALLVILPETPRWLAAHDRPEQCREILERLHPNDPEHVQWLHGHIMETVAFEASIGAGSWKDLLKEDEIKSRRRFLIACAIQSFQQLGGINAIICKSTNVTLLRLTLHPCVANRARLTNYVAYTRLHHDAIRAIHRFQRQYVGSHVGLLTNVVLRRVVYPVVPH